MNHDVILAELEALKTRIEALEANAGLRKFAARIEAPIARVPEEGVRISYPPDPNSFMMPNNGELKKLRVIACGEYPKLRPDFSNYLDAEKAEFESFEEFSRAFLRIGNLGRIDKLNKKVSLSWWVGEAQEWLRLHNIYGEIRGSAFCAAVLAHGDIGFLPADGEQGWVWTFAMAPHGGRRATDGWKQVLRTGQIKKPEGGSRMPATPPVRMIFETTAEQ
jgi:hypothetical protein